MLNYKKQDFRSDQLLKAEHLNYIEDGIEQIFNNIEEICPPLNLEDNLISCYPLEGIFLNPKSYIEATQAGSGDPSPDNIRAISGWNGATLIRCGKNILDVPDTQNLMGGVSINVSNNRILLNGISTLSATNSYLLQTITLHEGNYTLTYKIKGGNAIEAPENATVIRLTNIADATEAYSARLNKSSVVFTLTKATTFYVSVLIAVTPANYQNFEFVAQLERGNTATEYEAPKSQTLTAQFPKTIYGGSYDWQTGELEEEWVFRELDGTEGWDYRSNSSSALGAASGYFYLRVGDLNTYVSTGIMCSHYPQKQISSANTWQGVHLANSSQGEDRIVIRPDLTTIDSLEKWITHIQAEKAKGTPVTIIYKLLVPYTIQLTPQQILAISGTNNIWSNTGKTKISSFANPAKIIKDNEETIENLKMRTSALESAFVNNV